MDAVVAELGELGILGISFDLTNPHVIAFANEHQAALLAEIWPQVNHTTHIEVSRAVAAGLEEGETITEIAARIRKIGEINTGSRALMIARTETARAQGAGTLQGYIESGVVEEKEWLTAFGACEKCEPLNGDHAPLDEPFPKSGIMYPPKHPRCRCTTIARLKPLSAEG